MTLSIPRALLIVGVAVFAAVFQWSYITWVSPTFDYIGFHYEPPPGQYLALGWLLALLPSLWLADRLTRPSQFILWVLYLAVFIPSMFVPLYIALQDYGEVAVLMLTMFAGFGLVTIGTTLPLIRMRFFRVSTTMLWTGLCVVSLALLGWVATVFAGHMRFVSFRDVYESIRFSGAEVAEGTGVNYAVMWLSGAFLPFMMAWGLLKKRPGYFTVGALGQILLYATGGLKGVLLSIPALPLLWVCLRGSGTRFAARMTWAIALAILLTNLANLAVSELGDTQLMFSAVLLMRTFAVPGMVTGQYAAFFADHPVTCFSHVNGINAFLEYPYQGPIGKEVGYFYTGNIDYNANAHLWCMDGIAGFGLPGVLLISVLCALVFWVLDSASHGQDPLFAALATSFTAFNLSNVSLFTTLLSGGFIFSILLLYLKPTDERERTGEDLAGHRASAGSDPAQAPAGIGQLAGGTTAPASAP